MTHLAGVDVIIEGDTLRLVDGPEESETTLTRDQLEDLR